MRKTNNELLEVHNEFAELGTSIRDGMNGLNNIIGNIQKKRTKRKRRKKS